MKKLSFINKGENLKNLSTIIKNAKILPLVMVDDIDNKNIISNIQKLGNKVILRSSASNEDTDSTSNAGAFLSIPNINTNDTKALKDALRKVKSSMGWGCKDNYILVQPMLESIDICGVAFSVDKDNYAPYFCISYDESGSSDSVTSGQTSNLTNIIVFREHKSKNKKINKIIKTLLELESIFDNNALDVEFAFTKNGDLYILQVRPLVMKNKNNYFNAINSGILKRLQTQIDNLSLRHPHILGDKTIFGVMPDWNPAEIIGLKPKRLALSLYKELVTDNIWAYQRDNYGYRNLRSHPLMYSFLGVPYIDVRLSFNSFIPKKLDETIANKLVNYYLKALESKPHLHDKIEFDIVFSCYDFNLPNKLQILKKHGFNQNELKRIEFSLLTLTNNILDSKSGLYLKDLNKIALLESRFDSIMQSNLNIIDKIYWLIEDCKRFGTLPFAGIARAAFVAMQMINSLVDIGFFSVLEKNQFLLSLKTINKELSIDMMKMQNNSIKKEEFLDKYGHLRAGSYNILSPCYKEAFDIYFSNTTNNTTIKQDNIFRLSKQKESELDTILMQNGIQISAKELFDFFRIVIEGRELAKFKFTKLLSSTLDFIALFGKELNISKEDLSHLDINNILSLQSTIYKDPPSKKFRNEIQRHKEEYKVTQAIKLPPLIINSNDILYFSSLQSQPNFITQKIITAKIALESDVELENKIVLIDSADPGYDYLFTKNIAGLITCYGGANSHMAIRCSELSLPAVIGVGEDRFKTYKNANKLTIDSLNNQVFIL
ncbi:PEP-utilizing enzyme [Helicobacter sp. MIT 99-5507]|uniref:PEP-utilizing enzyme n=1 Tax=Helicobacter sp. MIT 99-5507 TaxID=152489 RepID=UPI000E1E5B14|nr:PEP-utilizing enzyme [Helicobacter sp. MIT 99-5507]RDU58255.1 hypothetical protein CQA42_00160 [Helicobacter sp. MIT 99-5507]